MIWSIIDQENSSRLGIKVACTFSLDASHKSKNFCDSFERELEVHCKVSNTLWSFTYYAEVQIVQDDKPFSFHKAQAVAVKGQKWLSSSAEKHNRSTAGFLISWAYLLVYLFLLFLFILRNEINLFYTEVTNTYNWNFKQQPSNIIWGKENRGKICKGSPLLCVCVCQ